MFVPCIWPYINHCNNNIFLFNHSTVVDYYTWFYLFIHEYILCPLQSHKTSKQRITVWRFNNINKCGNINKWGNINEPVPTSIAPHLPGAAQFTRYISLNTFITPRERDAYQVLIIMNDDGSLGYWSRKNSHSYYCHHNNKSILFPVVITTTMTFPKKKVLKCLLVRKVVEIGLLRPDTFPQFITEVVGVGHFCPANLSILMADDILV